MDIELVDMAVSGSRCRGLSRKILTLMWRWNTGAGETEDSLFNTFNEDGLRIGGVKVDINPITEGKTGTLGQYLPGVEAYLEENVPPCRRKAQSRHRKKNRRSLPLRWQSAGSSTTSENTMRG